MSDQSLDGFRIKDEPYYLPVAGEVDVLTASHKLGLPILLKGPTGCGKTRFLTYMAHRLKLPLITVACHEDLSASDLTGRFLITGGQTTWVDGPLTTAVRNGAICYLDEIVEARKDTTVLIHPLTDDRRLLALEKRGELIQAHPDFMLVMSYNPGYQSLLKELKPSTRQRFVAIEFEFPPADIEKEILINETGVDPQLAATLVRLAGRIRALTEHGLEEGVSTRLLVHAARLVKDGLPLADALKQGVVLPLSDDPELIAAMEDIISDFI